ncbi:hypothetical protein JCM6882_007498 [Rhodosporidiobolus microsporus]
MASSDFDDDLLALAEGPSKRKNKSSSSKPSKRRRQADSDDGSASDMDMSQSDSDAPASSPRGGRGRRVKSAAQVDSSDESEDDGPAPTADNPYPLEGIFRDEADRKYVMGLPELQREDIIGTRRDEVTAREMRKQVAQISNQTGRGGAADSDEEPEEEDDDDEEYGVRSSRSRKTVGSSKSKSEGIEKLKKSRADKGKKKEKKAEESDDDYEELARRTRKSRKDDSGSDMDESDSDADERSKKGKGKKTAQPVGPEELQGVTLTRTKLAELCPAPWFGEWIKNAWVRYSVGMDHGEPQYRVCQVVGVSKGKTYRLENTNTDVLVLLKFGKAERLFSMDAVSNAPFTPREYVRLTKTCETDGVSMPTPKEVAKVKDQLAKRTTYMLTEEDLAKTLAGKKKHLTGAQRKTQLRFERDQAMAAGDQERIDEINQQLADLDRPSGEPRDPSAKLNERNRLSNREEVRRAEAKSQEDRRKQQEAMARGDVVKVDASARVKTVPRMNYDSRPHTPNPGTPGGSGRATPLNGAPLSNGANGGPRAAKGGKVESTVASRVQLDADLLDF